MSGARHYTNFYDDAEVLRILWQCDGCKVPASTVAVGLGVSRSAVCGLINRLRRAGDAVETYRFADRALLAMMDALHGRNEPADAIGRRMGLPRNAVLWLAHQIRLDTARARWGEHLDGTEPLGWWTAGAALQEAA